MARLQWLGALLFVFFGLTNAAAQGYPARPGRLIIPSQAGGSTDILGRVLARVLQDAHAFPMVIENKGGAGGTIGVAAAAKSPPDGYTLLLSGPEAIVVGPHLNPAIGFDSQNDLTPLAMLA